MRYSLKKVQRVNGEEGWEVSLVTYRETIHIGTYKSKGTAANTGRRMVTQAKKKGRVKGRLFSPDGCEGDFQVDGFEMREGGKNNSRPPVFSLLAAFLERNLLDLTSPDVKTREDAKTWFSRTVQDDVLVDKNGGISLSTVADALGYERSVLINEAQNIELGHKELPREFRVG